MLFPPSKILFLLNTVVYTFLFELLFLDSQFSFIATELPDGESGIIPLSIISFIYDSHLRYPQYVCLFFLCFYIDVPFSDESESEEDIPLTIANNGTSYTFIWCLLNFKQFHRTLLNIAWHVILQGNLS